MIGLLIVSHLLPVFPLADQSTAPTARIDGDVFLTLERPTLTARMTYNYIYMAGDTVERGIGLYLNGEFKPTSLSCGVCKSYSFDRQAKRLHSAMPLLEGGERKRRFQ